MSGEVDDNDVEANIALDTVITRFRMQCKKN